jgi:hypothetical protein
MKSVMKLCVHKGMQFSDRFTYLLFKDDPAPRSYLTVRVHVVSMV